MLVLRKGRLWYGRKEIVVVPFSLEEIFEEIFVPKRFFYLELIIS